MGDENWYHLEFTRISDETQSAFEVVSPRHGRVWVPKSVVEGNGREYNYGDRNGSMCVYYWLAEKRGWV